MKTWAFAVVIAVVAWMLAGLIGQVGALTIPNHTRDLRSQETPGSTKSTGRRVAEAWA